MARRKKPKREPQEPKLPKAPEKLSTPFADALRDVRVESPRKRKDAPLPSPRSKPAAPPSPPPPRAEPERSGYTYEDRVAMSQLYRDVRPLSDPRGRAGAPPPRRVAPVPEEAPRTSDALARQRLAALVAGGIRFDLRRDEIGRVTGTRSGGDPNALRDLRGGRARPDAEIDLHGLRADEAEAEVVRFVRDRHRRGARIVRIVHGKGLHSDAGLGVLGDRTLHALTEGGAAPFVLALTSAAPEAGGTGALVVRLVR